LSAADRMTCCFLAWTGPGGCRWLDPGDGFGSAVLDSGLERGVIELVLVGVGFGEIGEPERVTVRVTSPG
jgi:hypothetical protein